MTCHTDCIRTNPSSEASHFRPLSHLKGKQNSTDESFAWTATKIWPRVTWPPSHHFHGMIEPHLGQMMKTWLITIPTCSISFPCTPAISRVPGQCHCPQHGSGRDAASMTISCAHNFFCISKEHTCNTQGQDFCDPKTLAGLSRIG